MTPGTSADERQRVSLSKAGAELVANRSTKRGNGQYEIVAAAQRLIAAGGMASFSIRELMEEADMSLGSYTWHFGRRAELLEAALNAHVADIERVVTTAVREARDTPDTAVETLRAALLDVSGDRTRCLVAAELRLHAARDIAGRALQDRVDAAMASVLTLLHELLDQPRSEAAVQDTHDRLMAMAVRHAVQWRDQSQFHRAVQRTLNDAYGGL